MTSSQDIQLAVNRILRALSGKRLPGHRDIRLGLDRINRVVPDKQEWKGVHVAGTNGKGSICAFLAGLFKLGGIGYGSFTSPAFPESHNGITINGLYVNPRMYEMEKSHVQAKWDRIASGWKFRHAEEPDTLSPFELETATAFRVFDKMHVPYGIVEVGMGGATDATNAMKQKAVTVISKIGLDHQEFLGNSLENIAKVKAGIMQKNVPCIVDHTNPPSVVRVLREHAREVGTDLILTWKAEPFLLTLNNTKWKLESYQIQNLLCAALAFRHMFPHKEINLDKLMATEPYLPGRMEQVEVSPESSGREGQTILVDGAHNMLGIEGLVGHVNKWLRKDEQPVTWVMGMSSSKHKPFDKIIEKVVQPQDNLAFVEFTQGPNDPAPAPANYGADHAKTIVKSPDQVYNGEPEVGAGLRWACDKAGEGGPVVVTGSLYLIRDLFKLDGIHRKRELGTRRPGRSQLYRYTKLAQERKLTAEEEQEFKRARRHWRLSPIRNTTFTGDKINAAEVSADTSELQRKAAYHKTQAEGYQKTIFVVQNDMRNNASNDSQSPNKVVESLADKLESLKEQMTKHREEYTSAMLKIRGRYPLSNKKFMGHLRIFGRPRTPKGPTKSPFLAPEGSEGADASTSSKLDSWGQTVEEAAATATSEEMKEPGKNQKQDGKGDGR
ncbi:folylpolyglutamate synthase [Neonectria punicea]|uniref:Folylpolyglutamate synthase n=1 Tax=Neonectria punicea TaxID=979145 RepID=A0ABR1HVI8_9HYPO